MRLNRNNILSLCYGKEKHYGKTAGFEFIKKNKISGESGNFTERAWGNRRPSYYLQNFKQLL